MKTKNKHRLAVSETSSKSVSTTSRAGSNAGRGFRYQDAVTVWLAVEIWADKRSTANVIPEGGDDIELRGDTTNFVQVKSRRKHLGNYTESKTVKHIEDLWNRSLGSTPRPQGLELILERKVTGLSTLDDHPSTRSIEGPIRTRLSNLDGSSDLLSKTSITVVTSPQEGAIDLIVSKLGCTPLAAQMCFSKLLDIVGSLSNDNGRLTPENYRGLSISDTEKSIRDVLAAIDIDAIECAIRNGVCEPVDFLTPLNDPNFYLGVDVEPGHIAAGLVAERPQGRLALMEGIEQRRAALVVGPSGAGKSALMWETARTLRHTVRWFRIRRLGAADIPSLLQIVRTFRTSEDSPLGFVMDDIGRNGPENWGALLKEAMSVPGVVLLGSVREEDITLIAERARAAEIRADPDDQLAERLWRELDEAETTNWAGWREPWKKSEGLLLEYVHILTHGKRIHELLADQVAARVSDSKRSLELDILRSVSWAGATNVEVDASRLARALSVSEADLSRALKRLVQEHLVRSPAPSVVTGLHQLRSEKLLFLTHQTVLPTLETSFKRTVTSVSVTDLEFLVADTLSAGRLPISPVLDALVARLESEQDARALASALRGLGIGRIALGVDEWLEMSETRALSRIHVGKIAMLGIANIDLSDRIISEVQFTVDRLSKIKDSPGNDPRHLLMERMSHSVLSAMIKSADLSSLDEIFGALVGMHVPAVVRASLMRVPEDLLKADLNLVGSVLGTLFALNREIANHWVAEVEQKTLFARVQAETAWAGPVIIEDTDDEVIVHCDLWYVADFVQEDPHGAITNLCELILALCPSADIAVSNAITVSGKLAGFAQLPLATNRISRENLLSPSVRHWNRQWFDMISRRIAAPNYSDYLAKCVIILETLVPTLEKVLDAHFRGKDLQDSSTNKLNSLKIDIEALTSPDITTLKMWSTKNNTTNTDVIKFHNLLHSASGDVFARFEKLPDQAGAYIGWLGKFISDINTITVEEPWQLIGDGPPPMLAQLNTFLELLRAIARESHERKEEPAKTWVTRGEGARIGNVMSLISTSANALAKKRLAQRKAELEHLAEEAGVAAQFHLRVKTNHILPWRSADVLALLPAVDIDNALDTLIKQTEFIQLFVGSSIHLTIMPCIKNLVIPVLARSGCQTLLPDMEGATFWAEQLELPQAPYAMTGMFWKVVGLSNQLGAMNQKRLGNQNSPEEEIVARKNLKAAFAREYKELTQYLNTCAPNLQSHVFELIKHLQTGNIDFAAEAHAAIDGISSDIVQAVGNLSLSLMYAENEKFSAKKRKGIQES